MKKGVSVIICCYNSANRLLETIKHIALQKVPNDVLWEVIIVDNASSDGTALIAQNEWKKYNLSNVKFSVLTEPQPGLTYARNKGVINAIFELILFCDDDNWLHCDYIANGYKILENDITIGVLAGRSEVVSDIPIPFWFSTYQNSYAVGVLSLNSGDVTNRRDVWGAGMMFRKSVYTKLLSSGFKHYLSDRLGTELSSGGDTEICAWYIMVGLKLWYSEELFLQHYMPQNRLTKEYYKKLNIGQGKSSGIIHQYYHLYDGLNDNFGVIKSRKYRNVFRYFFLKLVKGIDAPFYLSSNMQIYYPKARFSEFTKNVLLARDLFLKQ